jgi:hypothetical protein
MALNWNMRTRQILRSMKLKRGVCWYTVCGLDRVSNLPDDHLRLVGISTLFKLADYL